LKCFPPNFNSKLKNIFLSLLFLSSDRTQFGNNDVFRILIDEIKYLQDVGITVNIRGQEHTIFFKLAQLLGDNLGLNGILGYTQSFSAHHFCRVCRISKKQANTAAFDCSSLQRTQINYKNDVDLADVSETGIKEESVWNQVPGFHVTQNVAFDIMHDLLEGVCRYDLSKIFYHFICDKQFFSWDTLNARVQGFDFEDGVNRPPVIEPFKSGGSVAKMKASEMMCLMKNLPIMTGDLVPVDEPAWLLYLCLRHILDIVLSSDVCNAQLILLQTLVAEHHQDYVHLFDDNLKPKHHFMLHYAEAISCLGPLCFIWSMRFESKHGEAKKTAAINCNYVNICKSIAQKHQLKLCYRLMSREGLVSNDLTVGTGRLVKINTSESLLSGSSENHFHANWIKFNGVKFVAGKAVLLGVVDDMPSFGVVRNIYVDGMRNAELVVAETETLCFDEHYHAYQVITCSSTKKVQLNDLVDYRTLHCHKSPAGDIGFLLTMHCAL
jgi:hypothetical protein